MQITSTVDIIAWTTYVKQQTRSDTVFSVQNPCHMHKSILPIQIQNSTTACTYDRNKDLNFNHFKTQIYILYHVNKG